tara:strand:+ start:258 stop:521 length:264 start_codon:yes stop_codon:yes gene_type:complete
MKPQEANKLIAEFMGDIYRHTSEDKYHASWDWLMPVITRLKQEHDWFDEEGQWIIDDIDNGLTCCWGIDEVYRSTVEAIVNFNEWKS